MAQSVQSLYMYIMRIKYTCTLFILEPLKYEFTYDYVSNTWVFNTLDTLVYKDLQTTHFRDVTVDNLPSTEVILNHFEC